jgi:hypothetical protein
MKSDIFLTRRSLLGAALLSAALPHSALAQAQLSREPDMKSMRIEIAFSNHVFTVTLYDNPSARELVSMLPLDLTTDDYSTNEKIAYLPRKLTEEGSGPFRNEAPGDLCYFAPWGNLAFFHGGYSYSRGLIRLGRLDHGFEPLLTRGKFPMRITRL